MASWTIRAFFHRAIYAASLMAAPPRKSVTLPEVDEEDRLHDLLKYGLSVHHWNGFVFQAYHHHQYDAIFLAGLPDVKGSLPHA